MRALVTGAGGGVGRAFREVVPPHHDVYALARADLDIGDRAAVRAVVGALAPEVIVNLAAFTKVDACESDPSRAYRDNTAGPHNLALAARDAGAVLVHVSTDYVFDGEMGAPYDELDEPAPRSVYGRSKLGGERMVRHTLAEHVIVRTGFVFGGGSDFLSGQLERLAAGDRAAGLADRIGSPTYARDLAALLTPLAVARRFGTLHVAGAEPTTWHDVLLRAKRIGGLPGEVAPQRAEDLDLPAPRPRNSSLASLFLDDVLDEVGASRMPPLDDALADLLARRR